MPSQHWAPGNWQAGMWRVKSISAVHPKLDNPLLEDKKKDSKLSARRLFLRFEVLTVCKTFSSNRLDLGLGYRVTVRRFVRMDRLRVRSCTMQYIYESSMNVCVSEREREHDGERRKNVFGWQSFKHKVHSGSLTHWHQSINIWIYLLLLQLIMVIRELALDMLKSAGGVKRLCNVQLVCFLSSRSTAIKPCFKCDKFFQSKFCQTMLNIKYNNVLSGFSENTTISYFSAQRLSNSVGNKIAMRWISWHC